MGAPERSGGGIGVNYGVGTIVWVRRRNGSWWPGRILGQEELSASHVRSGTPVKLLGREDASVDWYNLEKSKRVKAFRCGEFDACIERAEASQGIPIKKREKYARREDAILHALELEKEQLELKKQQSGAFSNSTSKKISGSRKRDLHDFASDLYTRKGNLKAHGKSTSKKSQMIPKKVGLPVEEIYADKKKSGKQVSSGENVLEAIPRMRGLQDFGPKIVPSKRKLSQAVACQTSINSVDDHVEVQSSAGHTVESVRNVGGNKNFFLSKSKRSEDSMIEESLAKRSDKQHAPVQVLQCNAKLQVSQFPQSEDTGLVTMQREADPLNSICRAKRTRCIYLPSNSSESLDHLGDPHEQTPILESQFEMDSLGEECTSSVIVEPSYSDSSETNYVEPGADEHLNPPSDTTQKLVPESQNSVGHTDREPSGDEVAQINGDMNTHEVHLPGYMSELHLPKVVADASNDTGVSKWHMKGKRNIRHVTNRPMDAVDRKVLSSITSKIGKSESLTQGTLGHVLHTKKQGISSAYDALDLLDDDSGHAQTLDYGSQRKTLAFKAAKGQMRSHCGFNGFDNASNTMSPTGWEADGFYHAPQRAYWDESCEHLESIYPDHHNDEWEPKLVVVDLKVQASSYKGEHNPLVSLMSRLNGKAIVGHPVQIETLEDGSIGSLLFRGDVGLDDGTKTTRVWRTGKRTAMQRVARINPVSTALESEGIEPDKCPGSESKPPPIKAYSGHFSCQTRSKKSISHISRSSPRKVQQKLQKKFKLSSQKTRMLSSIATEHKLGGEKRDAKHLRGNKLLGGLIKSEATMPLVTCVPVKEVFCRIMEAISRPPSAAGHRIR